MAASELVENGDRPLKRHLPVTVVAALALLFTMVLPVAQAKAIESAGDLEFERIETAGSGGYIVQVADGESTTEVLADSQGVAANEVEDLSGEAFNGAVADIDPAQAKQLRADPRVVSVERDKVITVNANDEREPLDGSQWAITSREKFSATAMTTAWGLDRTDQRNLPLDSDYSPPANGSDVHVYVVDSGVDLDHSDFGGRIGLSAYAVGGTALDCHGHGTHVAGTAASNNYGMAKGATVHSVRVLDCEGTGSKALTIAGLNWIAENAEPRSVVNLSLGGTYSSAQNAAVASLVADGIPVVASAGNEAVDACNSSPASAEPAITVGAVDGSDSDAIFSNFGPCLDVYAPGVDIKSLLLNQPGSSSTKSGTSMAAPHVAGALAVLWSQDLSLSGNQIDDHLLNQATPGVVNFPFGQGGSPNLNLYMDPTDTNPPDTRITSGTSGRVNSRRAKFSFASTAAASTFECRLDDSAWQKCTSSESYTGLANGKHTFLVRGTDQAGNTDTTPAVRSITTAKRLTVKANAVRNGSKLLVDVNPNNSAKNYKIKLKQKKSGKWKTVRVTYTKGPRDKRIINMPKGKYKVMVPAQHDLLGATSTSVRLSR
jgi:subtilisin family serine protease